MAVLNRIAPFAVALLLLAAFCVPPASGATAYEYFLFAVQWPFSVCSEKKCTYNDLPNDFTIHGLWPRNYSVSQLNCTGTNFNISEMDAQQQKSLAVSWPDVVNNANLKLWEYEYNKHGRCCDNIFTQKEYFEKADELWRQHRVEVMFKNKGYEPGKTYNLTDLQGAVRNTTTKDPALRCRDVKKELGDKQLVEVFICFDYNGKNVIDCSSTLTNCGLNETILWKKGPN